MNGAVTLSRWGLGLIFLLAALNGWAVILDFGAFLPTSPVTEAFLGDGYLLVLVKATELVCAVFLLTGAFIPLTLTALFPLVGNIFLFHFLWIPECSRLRSFSYSFGDSCFGLTAIPFNRCSK